MRIQDTIQPLAHIHVAETDYNVYISICLATRHMHIFKYNDTACEYEIFDGQEDACQFISKPLPGTSSKFSGKSGRSKPNPF
jgi:hypothetical protein